MSSLHESSRDTGWHTDNSSPAGAGPDAGPDKAAGTRPAPSYSTRFHLNYVTTFHGTENRVEDKNVHHILYTCRPEAGTSNAVRQTRMSITCQIDVKGERDELRLQIDSSTRETGLALPTDADPPAEKSEATEDELKSVREKRTAALNEMFGIWKDRDDIPDGLQFQREMREEWR